MGEGKMKETLLEYMQRRLKQYREMKVEKTLPIQRDFPNCQKYKACCDNDKEFWDKIQDQPPVKDFIKMEKKQLNIESSPEGFEGW